MDTRMFRTALSGATLTLAFSLVVVPVAARQGGGNPGQSGQISESPNRIYIVQMVGHPVVAYKGGIDGLAATAAKRGQKIDPSSSAVVAYVDYLRARHDAALGKVGGGRKLYDYTFSFNGFAAELSLDQANSLRSVDGVLAVSADELQSADTSSTPSFLGLDEPGGLWELLGGSGRKKTSGPGEDVIIGVVDSGIWPESASLSDRDAAGKLVYQRIPSWHGKCVAGEEFKVSDCNQKLIGAQYYNAGYGGDAGIDSTLPWEYNSPRDFNGHGTHTSSTAGGNQGVATTGEAAVFGAISGMAPRARIAMYKALWSTEDAATASGFNSDLVAAIDAAVADGVDVINYSVSGTRTDFFDPVQAAFLNAAQAGIFVAASAGNSGPTTATVAHPGPWLTTVAAGTHDRSGEGSATLGNGSSYYGASVAANAVTAPLIDSVAAALPGADPTQVALCYGSAEGALVLDSAKVAGKIVVCDRGVTARINKSLAVWEAGGVGMVLVNTTASSLNADLHFIPTVHLQDTDRPAVKAYAATSGATATVNRATIVYGVPAPYTASFSSRGPLQAGNGDLLKPDLIAPGQDILAAVSPTGNHGLEFNLYSGTSMSSPHVAGLAALLRDLHRDWTPMMIKSALMTSGYDVLDGPNTSPLVIFRQGAGHVRPNSAADPGLVFDAGWDDWQAFLCGTTTSVDADTCEQLASSGYSSDPSDLNVASIAIGDLAGVQTVTRKVTNVGKGVAAYSAFHTGMEGFDVAVAPSSLTLNPGETESFTVRFTRTTAALNAYAGGQLSWAGGAHMVRIPMVVKPVALAAPAEVWGDGGPLSYGVKFGYDGSFSATPRGLVPAVVTAGTVSDDPTDSSCSLTSPNAQLIPVTIPADTSHVRFSLFDVDVAPGADLDLCVFRGWTLVGSSGSGTSAEEVNLLNPPAADYTVVVQGWGVAGSSPFKLHTWLLGSADAGNTMVVAPATASIGAAGTIDLTFVGLTAATKYLGSVAYGGVDGMPNPTVVRVDMP